MICAYRKLPHVQLAARRSHSSALSFWTCINMTSLSTVTTHTSSTLKAATKHRNDQPENTFKPSNTPPHHLTPDPHHVPAMGNCLSGCFGGGGGGGGRNSRRRSAPATTSRRTSGASDRRYQNALREEYEMTRGRRYSRHDSVNSRHDGPLPAIVY